MIDRYTKIVLTVIAGALVTLCIQNTTAPAVAQLGASSNCGTSFSPCFVSTSIRDPLYVRNIPF